MPLKFGWENAEEIGIQLQENYPDLDPLTIRFTDMHRMIVDLAGFTGDPGQSNERILEAIQMAWLEEYNDAK